MKQKLVMTFEDHVAFIDELKVKSIFTNVFQFISAIAEGIQSDDRDQNGCSEKFGRHSVGCSFDNVDLLRVFFVILVLTGS